MLKTDGILNKTKEKKTVLSVIITPELIIIYLGQTPFP